MASRKPLEELTLKDDYMFYAVFHDADLLKPLLEEILNTKIAGITVLNLQKTQKNSYEGKGVRLDLYCEDGNGHVFNVEMESRNKGPIPLRSRYYADSIDGERLKAGASYKDLPPVFVFL